MTVPRPATVTQQPSPVAGPIAATFYDADGTKHEGLRFRQSNARDMYAYRDAVNQALRGDDTALDALALATPIVYDMSHVQHRPLVDGRTVRRIGEPVILWDAPATRRKAARHG